MRTVNIFEISTSKGSDRPYRLSVKEKQRLAGEIEGPDVHYPRSMSWEEKCDADVLRIQSLKP